MTPPELVEPEVPRAVRHVWRWFWDLDATRPPGMVVSAITFTEMAAWRDLTGEIVRPWEVRLLKEMDAERLAVTASLSKRQDS